MPRRSKAIPPAVTRDLKRIRALTQLVQWPELDEPTRARLHAMALTARNRLDAGDLPGALTALCAR